MIVRVYWNLHRKCYSVVDRRTGRVIDHAASVYLRDVRLTVQPAGRRKTLQTGCKCVHAFLTGERMTLDNEPGIASDVAPYYNPYRVETWTDKGSGDVLTVAAMIVGHTVDGRPVLAGWSVK